MSSHLRPAGVALVGLLACASLEPARDESPRESRPARSPEAAEESERGLSVEVVSVARGRIHSLGGPRQGRVSLEVRNDTDERLGIFGLNGEVPHEVLAVWDGGQWVERERHPGGCLTGIDRGTMDPGERVVREYRVPTRTHRFRFAFDAWRLDEDGEFVGPARTTYSEPFVVNELLAETVEDQ